MTDINAVQWTSMQHAYGAASNIPDLLTKIAANDAKAVTKMADSIAHQGWLIPDIALALVPYLVESVSIMSGATKAQLIGLLSDLACGGSYEHVVGQRLQGNIFQELIANNSEVAAVRHAVVANSAIIVECLNDAHAIVRAAAAQFIAVTMSSIELLAKKIAEEKNETTKADMLIACAWSIQSNDDSHSKIIESHLNSTNDAVRFAAAIGLAYFAPLTDSLLAILYQGMEADSIKRSVWCDGKYYNIIVKILVHRASDSKNVNLLLNAFLHVPHTARFNLIASLLRDNFKHEIKSTIKPPKQELLSELQINILKLIVEYQVGGSTIEYALKAIGLPQTPPAVGLYLGIPRPMELIDSQLISFKGEVTSIREAIERYCGAKKSEAADEDQIKILAEAIAAQTDVHHFMDMAFSISKPLKKERHLLVLYFLLAGGKTIEQQLSKKIDELLEAGGTQHYYELCAESVDAFFCTGDSLLLLIYWTALHHINSQHAIPITVEKYPAQHEPRSLKSQYQYYGLRIYAGYHARPWFIDAYNVCKTTWQDLMMCSIVQEYGWHEHDFE